MGEVWRGVDELLGREVAVKLLKHEYATDPTFRARFRAEARYTARLSHPGIAQVYDYGEHDDVAFLVMELVPGEPLSAILARHGRLTPDVTLDIVSQAARALQSAHDVGLIHRDIKPGNLLVTSEGTVKLTDFGIARAAEAVTLTQTGMVMGTAHYVSPEQAAGKTLTPATDIYSLGVVAYECLAGNPPFTAETVVTVALQHVRESPPPLPEEVPESAQELVAVALEKDPAARPGTAGEFADRAHLVRESLALGGGAAARHATGETALTELLASGSGVLGPEAPSAHGTDWDDRRTGRATAEQVPTEQAAVHAAAGAPGTTEFIDGPARQTSEATVDGVLTDADGGEEPARRRRRGPVLAFSTALILIVALVVGAMWLGDRDKERQARQVRATTGPSSGEIVPPDREAPAAPVPQGTSEESTRGGGPGGNIGPRQPPGPSSPAGSPRPSSSASVSPSPSKTSQEPSTSPDGEPQRDEQDNQP
ncbi:MAG: protein kinase [Streptosporangiales bacterium]|nr:protein kinase [Streptosporangiales bacterium]